LHSRKEEKRGEKRRKEEKKGRKEKLNFGS